MKNYALSSILALMLIVTSCGTTAYQASSLEDSIYYTPSQTSDEFAQVQEQALQNLTQETQQAAAQWKAQVKDTLYLTENNQQVSLNFDPNSAYYVSMGEDVDNFTLNVNIEEPDWRYNGWYSPWYGTWHSPWYYGPNHHWNFGLSFGFHYHYSWYNPWYDPYFGFWGGYSPTWYDPWYGWYDPWYGPYHPFPGWYDPYFPHYPGYGPGHQPADVFAKRENGAGVRVNPVQANAGGVVSQARPPINQSIPTNVRRKPIQTEPVKDIDEAKRPTAIKDRAITRKDRPVAADRPLGKDLPTQATRPANQKDRPTAVDRPIRKDTPTQVTRPSNQKDRPTAVDRPIRKDVPTQVTRPANQKDRPTAVERPAKKDKSSEVKYRRGTEDNRGTGFVERPTQNNRNTTTVNRGNNNRSTTTINRNNNSNRQNFNHSSGGGSNIGRSGGSRR